MDFQNKNKTDLKEIKKEMKGKIIRSLKNNNLIRGFIYSITNLINKKKYFGSTYENVSRRHNSHISDFFSKYLKNSENNVCKKLCDAFYEYGLECFICEEIEMVYFENYEDLLEIEDEYIVKYNSIENGYNSQRAKNTKVESDKAYYQKTKNNPEFKDKRHKQYLREKSREGYKERIYANGKRFREKNKEKINAYKREKILCDICNIELSRNYMNEHIKTQDHLLKIKGEEKQYIYKGQNKKEYFSNKYQQKKERLKEIIKCSCGKMVTKGNLIRHKKTKKHLNKLN